MLPQSFVFFSAFLFCILWLAESHVRFVCPRPASVRSDISFSNQSVSYCGVDMKTQFDQEYTEVMPGLFTIRFEETQFHRNSPFRVSLHSVEEEEDYCLLLDHIPHNNHALFSNKCSEKGNDYPLGVCQSSTYFITVHIPDVACRRCYLRLTHVLLDSNDKMPCDLDNGTCTGYVSCANIQIRASSAGQGKNLSSCGHYEDNMAGSWPFRPRDQYQVEMVVGKDVKVEPLVVFDPLHSTLRLDIPQHSCPSSLREVQVTVNSSVLWNATVTTDNRKAETVVVQWTDMDSQDVQLLEDGQMVLGLKCDNDIFEGNLSLKEQSYSPGKYVVWEKVEYTVDGWLAGYRFRGGQATDISVVTPAGPCVPPPRNFISFLHLRDMSKFVHGILVASIVGDYADITVALYNIKDDVKSIIIHGSELVGAPDVEIPVPKEKTSILQVSLDISAQLQYIDTVQFLKHVEVRTSNPDDGLMGSFEEGMYTILREGQEIKGVGAFQFTKGQWLKYEILVTGLQSHIFHAEFQGEGGMVYNLSNSVWHLQDGFCLVEGLVQDLNSELLLQLWQGRLRMVGYANTSVMSGPVTIPGQVYCREARDRACYSVDMTANGEPPAQGLQTVPPTGLAIFLMEGINLLQYSIEVHDVKEHGRQVDMNVKDGKQLVFTLKLQPHPSRPATYTATSHLQVSGDLQKKLSQGGLTLEVPLTSIQPAVLRATMPPVTHHLCVQPKKRVVGDHRGFWSAEAAPFQPMFAMVGDTLEFQYSPNVSLFSLPNKEDFQACNFSNASQMGSEFSNDTHITYTLHLDREEPLFFASQQQCNDTPPLKLRVTVIPTVPLTVGDTMDNCGLLVLSEWRIKQLEAYSGPEPVGPAVAGVILGTLVALAFFFWDRRLQHKAEIAVPGSRFQRF